MTLDYYLHVPNHRSLDDFVCERGLYSGMQVYLRLLKNNGVARFGIGQKYKDGST